MLLKKAVNIQCNEILRDKENAISWEKLSEKRRRELKNYKYFCRLKTIKYRVSTEEIDTRDKLADFVRRNYGYGEFLVMFFDMHAKSKRYNRNFVCRLGCRKSKPGAVCKHNRRFVRAFTPRALIIIKPNDDPFQEEDYRYVWVEHSDGQQRDKMKMMFFWKGDVKKKKVREREGLAPAGAGAVEIFNNEE